MGEGWDGAQSWDKGCVVRRQGLAGKVEQVVGVPQEGRSGLDIL